MTRFRRIAAAALAILALAAHPLVVESIDPGAATFVDARRAGGDDPVSYTHLTLPTILRV